MSSTTLAGRIRQRLAATGKSASAVSLEAGLSRSGIRDILNGKAGNPRLDTLVKLAGALQCSVTYLTGQTDTLESGTPRTADAFNIHALSVRGVLKLGMYVDSLPEVSDETIAVPLPPDLAGTPWLFRLGDDALDGLGLHKDDLLIVETATAQHAGDLLSPGAVVVIRKALPGLPEGPFEYSARLVNLKKGALRLSTAPKMDPEKTLTLDRAFLDSNDQDASGQLRLHPETDGTVQVVGPVRRVIRDL